VAIPLSQELKNAMTATQTVTMDALPSVKMNPAAKVANAEAGHFHIF